MTNESDHNDRVSNPLGLVLGVRGSVGRFLYAAVGFSLMALKYATEALLIYGLTGKFFSPWLFVIPSWTLRQSLFETGPDWLPWAVVGWSLPFLWIAVTMSVRRAMDAGHSPWTGMLVIIPVINLPTMMYLAMAPRFDRQQSRMERRPIKGTWAIYSALLGMLVGGVFAFATTLISVYSLDSYGGSLFLGMPIVTGAVAGYIYNQPSIRGTGASAGVGALSVMFGGLGLLLFAFEGVICLVMASPLLVPMGGLGGFLGWILAKTILVQSKWMLGGAMLVVPLMTTVELQFREYKVEMVESSVVIDAPPTEVWSNVIAFPDIESELPWYFRLGIAGPLRARIDGEGVGAIRHCEFTTGDFVEPITVWDPPHRLAFDVADQPDALVELTPYRNVRPPHLQHSFRSVQGEFELIGLENGGTQLIGRTWYVIDMGPRAYWRLWTDQIIHRIHLRVLDHIRQQTK